ncbi:vitamin K epoxide reductase family protein [Homoserinibacter sp. YIM 151385]|uniref:vitamin K epoxide reductase family protein n=1 Tax=Homoserinibacter sp. YIM 151385 TaxID=2985506 RepID=UPI0022F11B17|nr:vitamin K epoxide reductase family protein [Homoserinibacter sp. YIM 151385]WBU38988.1 vitamin K epoxide reductase family protein [Homoserinibacter sp. YIM 151385]
MADGTRNRTPWLLASALVVLGLIGWIASVALALEKFVVLADPDAALSCDISVLVQCGKNLGSWQGAVFGFPNPVLGVAGFVAPIVVGAGLLAGARFARWFWIAFQLGLTGALVFVIWLISQSIYVLGTLCPWCMVVWSATIPMFISTLVWNLSSGHLGGGRRLGRALSPYVVPLTIAAYLVIALLAQLRLDVIGSLS